MSRTDAHNPLWVSLARGDLAALANHDHRDGACDLPDLRSLGRLDFERRIGERTKCWWEFAFTGTGVCSCWMCHAGPQRRADRRAARHRDRFVLNAAVGLWVTGDEMSFDEVAEPGRSSGGDHCTIVGTGE